MSEEQLLQLEAEMEEMNHRHEVDAHLIRGFHSDVDRLQNRIWKLEAAIREHQASREADQVMILHADMTLWKALGDE